MTEDEEGRPTRRQRRLEPLRLDEMGVEKLRDYSAELKAEISRVDEDISRKQQHRKAAASVFSTRDAARRSE